MELRFNSSEFKRISSLVGKLITTSNNDYSFFQMVNLSNKLYVIARGGNAPILQTIIYTFEGTNDLEDFEVYLDYSEIVKVLRFVGEDLIMTIEDTHVNIKSQGVITTNINLIRLLPVQNMSAKQTIPQILGNTIALEEYNTKEWLDSLQYLVKVASKEKTIYNQNAVFLEGSVASTQQENFGAKYNLETPFQTIFTFDMCSIMQEILKGSEKALIGFASDFIIKGTNTLYLSQNMPVDVLDTSMFVADPNNYLAIDRTKLSNALNLVLSFLQNTEDVYIDFKEDLTLSSSNFKKSKDKSVSNVSIGTVVAGEVVSQLYTTQAKALANLINSLPSDITTLNISVVSNNDTDILYINTTIGDSLIALDKIK